MILLALAAYIVGSQVTAGLVSKSRFWSKRLWWDGPYRANLPVGGFAFALLWVLTGDDWTLAAAIGFGVAAMAYPYHHPYHA